MHENEIGTVIVELKSVEKGVQERARVAVGLSKVFTGDFNSRW